VNCTIYCEALFLKILSCRASSTSATPWNDWELDPKFFSALSTRWTLEHPECTLDRVFDNGYQGIEKDGTFFSLIPNGPFPAHDLVGALSYFVKLASYMTNTPSRMKQPHRLFLTPRHSSLYTTHHHPGSRQLDSEVRWAVRKTCPLIDEGEFGSVRGGSDDVYDTIAQRFSRAKVCVTCSRCFAITIYLCEGISWRVESGISADDALNALDDA